MGQKKLILDDLLACRNRSLNGQILSFSWDVNPNYIQFGSILFSHTDLTNRFKVTNTLKSYSKTWLSSMSALRHIDDLIESFGKRAEWKGKEDYDEKEHNLKTKENTNKQESNCTNSKISNVDQIQYIQTNKTKPILIKEAKKILFQTYYYKMKNYDYHKYMPFYDEHFHEDYEQQIVADITEEMIKKNEERIPDDNRIKELWKQAEAKDITEEDDQFANTALNFPTAKNNTFTQIKSFFTIKGKSLMFIKECDVFELNENPKRVSMLSWSNIIELVNLYFYPKLAQTLKQIVQDYDHKLLKGHTQQIGLFCFCFFVFFVCGHKIYTKRIK